MDELLASIRKAIHDDIGDVPASASARSSGVLQRGPARELHMRVGSDSVSAAVEIQQLREKISRTRDSVAVMPREAPVLRETAALRPSLTKALQSETPRRSWRDINSPEPMLRPSVIDRDEAMFRTESRQREEPQPEPVPVYQEQRWADEAPALPPPPRANFQPRDEAEAILSNDSAQAVNAAFKRLTETVLSRATGDRSLEDMTRELLRGMLKQWLDDNLPMLVERIVREEIERVARNGR